MQTGCLPDVDDWVVADAFHAVPRHWTSSARLACRGSASASAQWFMK